MNAEQDALTMLRAHWSEELDEWSVPVDPVIIADRMGIRVYVSQLDPGVSGALEKRPGEDPSLYLNRSDSRNRQRFTCAHELGHFYKRARDGENQYAYVDHRAHLASTGTDPDEMYANSFAASLLMPRTLVDAWRDFMDPAEMAKRFEVSLDAMGYRLRNTQRF